MNKPNNLEDRFDYLQTELQQTNQSCTIDENEVEDRSELFDYIKNRSTNISRSEDRISLSFTTDHNLAHKIVDFSLKERQCCNFFNFKLDFSNDLETFDFHISSDTLKSEKFTKIMSTMIDT